MSTGHRKLPDQALSKPHIDEAIRTLMNRVSLDGTHWVPYLGGYSQDFRQHPTVYLDNRFPDSIPVQGKSLKPYRYILIHECVEKSLMDELGFSYEIAHDFATAAEKSAVEADGFSWAAYTKAITPYIKAVVRQPQDLQAPPDLDLTPYQQEHSAELPELEKEARQGAV